MTNNDEFLAWLQRRVDRVHESTPGAARPPADLWQRVLSQSRPVFELKENTNMSTTTSLASPAAAPSALNAEPQRGFRHYVNLAATLAIVATLALGGWFAAMQLQQPGDGPNSQLALISSTPIATPDGVCEVAPLTVDEVMEIIKNPAYYITDGPTAPPSEKPISGSGPDAELWEVDPSLQLLDEKNVPSQVQFDQASEVANQYLNCMINGTQGQVWRFYSPANLQKTILGEFPVFAGESEIRARVEERAKEPAHQGEHAWDLPYIADIGAVSVNPDYQLAILQDSESSFYDVVLTIGVNIEDLDGTQIALTNGLGADLIPNDPMITGRNSTTLTVTIAKTRFGNTWLVIPGPSRAELGW